jgi:hypothetical protein
MPRGKKGTYALEEDGNGGLAPVRIAGDPVGVPSVSSVQEIEERSALAGFAFSAILLRTDGWIRVIPCGDGKQNYFKYKYATGKHKGKYVMFVGAYNDWAGSLLGLYEKIQAVDTGTLKPAHDTFYDPR